jgi:glycosyltransferase involved in cell wall biosynthesis
MPIVLKRFPRARLFVAGQDVTGGRSLASRLKVTSYGKYIRELIRKNGLDDRVTFTGLLDEPAMRSRYLQSHVFALTSTIENSPNSLGEAMLLGVPCVAAAVGGVTDMARPDVDALTYQADAPYMLAHQICRVFSDDDLAERLSRNARSRAQMTHDIERNTATQLAIYHSILKEVKAA